MKKIFLIAGLLMLMTNVRAQYCSIAITPVDTTVCPGDSVYVYAIANLLNNNQYFDFNAGQLPTGWSVSGTSQFSEPCGSNSSGTPYYWAATSTSSNPSLTTAGFDVSCGGVITFDMVYAIQSGASPCEGPDEADEGVSLQYSTDGGATWITIVYYSPDGFEYPANPFVGGGVLPPGNLTNYTSWSSFSVPIPPGALGPNVMFQWIQESPTSGSAFDNWGIDNVVINASGPPCGNNAVVNWSNGLMDTTNFWVTPTTDTMFIAQVYDTLGNYMCEDTINIFVQTPGLNWSLVPDVSVNCPNDSAPVSIGIISGVPGPYSYSWTNGSTSSLTYLDLMNSGLDSLQHYVTITDGCGFQYDDSVMVYLNAQAMTYDLEDTVYLYCPNDSVTANITNLANSVPPYSFAWSNGDTTSTTYLYSGSMDQGTSMETVVITDGCGYTIEDTVVLVVNQTLQIDSLVMTPTNACAPDGSVIAYVSGEDTPGASYYHWDDQQNWENPGTGNFIDNDSWLNIGSGWHYFTVTDAVCTETDSVFVEMINAPIANLSGSPTSGCIGLTVNLLNSSQNTSYYYWDFGNGNDLYTYDQTGQTIVYGQSATVMLIAYVDDTQACGDTAYVNIDITPCGCTDPNGLNYNPAATIDDGTCIYPTPIVVAPNVFTPNNDGENDFYFPATENVVTLEYIITNRWGNVMFEETIDLSLGFPATGWNGYTPIGNAAQEGTYFYKYVATGINGDQVDGHGFLQLVRD